MCNIGKITLSYMINPSCVYRCLKKYVKYNTVHVNVIHVCV